MLYNLKLMNSFKNVELVSSPANERNVRLFVEFTNTLKHFLSSRSLCTNRIKKFPKRYYSFSSYKHSKPIKRKVLIFCKYLIRNNHHSKPAAIPNGKKLVTGELPQESRKNLYAKNLPSSKTARPLTSKGCSLKNLLICATTENSSKLNVTALSRKEDSPRELDNRLLYDVFKLSRGKSKEARLNNINSLGIKNRRRKHLNPNIKVNFGIGECQLIQNGINEPFTTFPELQNQKIKGFRHPDQREASRFHNKASHFDLGYLMPPSILKRKAIVEKTWGQLILTTNPIEQFYPTLFNQSLNELTNLGWNNEKQKHEKTRFSIEFEMDDIVKKLCQNYTKFSVSSLKKKKCKHEKNMDFSIEEPNVYHKSTTEWADGHAIADSPTNEVLLGYTKIGREHQQPPSITYCFEEPKSLHSKISDSVGNVILSLGLKKTFKDGNVITNAEEQFKEQTDEIVRQNVEELLVACICDDQDDTNDNENKNELQESTLTSNKTDGEVEMEAEKLTEPSEESQHSSRKELVTDESHSTMTKKPFGSYNNVIGWILNSLVVLDHDRTKGNVQFSYAELQALSTETAETNVGKIEVSKKSKKSDDEIYLAVEVPELHFTPSINSDSGLEVSADSSVNTSIERVELLDKIHPNSVDDSDINKSMNCYYIYKNPYYRSKVIKKSEWLALCKKPICKVRRRQVTIEPTDPRDEDEIQAPQTKVQHTKSVCDLRKNSENVQKIIDESKKSKKPTSLRRSASLGLLPVTSSGCEPNQGATSKYVLNDRYPRESPGEPFDDTPHENLDQKNNCQETFPSIGSQVIGDSQAKDSSTKFCVKRRSSDVPKSSKDPTVKIQKPAQNAEVNVEQYPLNDENHLKNRKNDENLQSLAVTNDNLVEDGSQDRCSSEDLRTVTDSLESGYSSNTEHTNKNSKLVNETPNRDSELNDAEDSQDSAEIRKENSISPTSSVRTVSDFRLNKSEATEEFQVWLSNKNGCSSDIVVTTEENQIFKDFESSAEILNWEMGKQEPEKNQSSTFLGEHGSRNSHEQQHETTEKTFKTGNTRNLLITEVLKGSEAALENYNNQVEASRTVSESLNQDVVDSLNELKTTSDHMQYGEEYKVHDKSFLKLFDGECSKVKRPRTLLIKEPNGNVTAVGSEGDVKIRNVVEKEVVTYALEEQLQFHNKTTPSSLIIKCENEEEQCRAAISRKLETPAFARGIALLEVPGTQRIDYQVALFKVPCDFAPGHSNFCRRIENYYNLFSKTLPGHVFNDSDICKTQSLIKPIENSRNQSNLHLVPLEMCLSDFHTLENLSLPHDPQILTPINKNRNFVQSIITNPEKTRASEPLQIHSYKQQLQYCVLELEPICIHFEELHPKVSAPPSQIEICASIFDGSIQSDTSSTIDLSEETDMFDILSDCEDCTSYADCYSDSSRSSTSFLPYANIDTLDYWGDLSCSATTTSIQPLFSVE